jgi:murein tripeptide amidase MpaA
MDTIKYFTNDEIEQQIHAWEQTYAGLIEVRELGRSYEKRPIWLLVLTNKATGADLEKPAVWIDANIHATEITGTSTAMHIAATLLKGYSADAQATRILDNSVYYVVPRLNPDGAALALAAQPKYIRSGVRLYPWQDRDDGLHEQDIDGDGRILQMRIEDPSGDWKISELDPRLLQKREPHENGGRYYRLMQEGLIENWDGYTVRAARRPEGLDFNRNYPFEWRTEGDQPGAGPYPASEPEIRAQVEFIANHPNINLAITYHTFSRVILRSYSTKSDDDMETGDLWVLKKLGEIGTKITGYRCVSTFHDFKYHPKEVTTGAFDDWMYDHLGAYAFTIELWDLPTAAGIENRKFLEWFREHPHEEDLKILKFVEENTAPGGYVDWYAFDHPQLGAVELGGWDFMYTWRNPPAALLPAEVEHNTPFALALGEMLPHLTIKDVQIKRLDEGTYHLTLLVENTGFLPSSTSIQGKKRKAMRPVRVELEASSGVELVNGKRRIEIGYLQGRSNKLDVATVWVDYDTDNRGRAEWTLCGQPGDTITIHLLSERAGTIHRTISLP